MALAYSKPNNRFGFNIYEKKSFDSERRRIKMGQEHSEVMFAGCIFRVWGDPCGCMNRGMSMKPEGPDPERVKGIFNEISARYDRANDFMTFGLVRRWRKSLVRWSGAGEGARILDCATGTGDLAIEFKKQVGDKGEVIGVDFCQNMLDLAPGKAQKLGMECQFVQADVTDLPFPENYFDVAGIAYGIRNVKNPRLALSEMARVCKPGGSVLVLETGDNDTGVFGKVHWMFSQYALPFLGKLATGKRGPYEYLRDSSRAFPSRDDFVQIMHDSHAFKQVEYRDLLMGSSFLYRGVVGGKTE